MEWDQRTRGWRASFGGLLFFAMAVGVFINSALSVLSPYIRADLDLSRAQIGTLATIVSLMAAVSSPFIGVVVDALGARRVLTLGFVMVAGSLALLGASPSYGVMIVAVAIAGIAVAVGNPSTNKLIAAEVPAGRQGLYVGIKQSGGQLNWALAGALLPLLASAFGWRRSLGLGVGFAALGVAALWLLLPHEPRTSMRAVAADRSGSVGSYTRWLCGYAFFMSAGMAASNTYLPLYAHEQVGMSEGSAGLLMTITAFMSMATRVLWARGTEGVLASPGRPLALMSAVSIVATAVIAASSTVGVGTLVVGALLFGSSATAWGSLVMLVVLVRAGTKHTGRASGMVLLAGHGGLVATPILFGYIVDKREGNYGAAWITVTVAYCIAAGIAVAWQRVTRN